MCLILFAIEPNADYRLIVAANRDEFYGRPTEAADYWHDHPGILAGRDKDAGGTWLGVSDTGRFAAVTNFKEEPPQTLPPLSRGELPFQFLNSEVDAATYTNSVSKQATEYRGFNLLAADHEQVYYYCNRQDQPKALGSGFYGLSNQVLDCDWPKVVDGRNGLQAIVKSGDKAQASSLFDLLMGAGDGREFSNSFISSDQYGTRAATVVLMKTNGEVYFEERNFGPGGTALDSASYSLSCNVCS